MKKELKKLAIACIKAELFREKQGIALKAGELINKLEFKSYSKLLKEIGISYFCGINSSQKVEKGKKENFDTLILYLAPAFESGVNVCSFASKGCIAACLNNSGRAKMEQSRTVENWNIKISRIVKTWIVCFRRDIANKLIKHEITLKSRLSERKGHQFCVRLNGTSDIDFNEIVSEFESIQFYDYTKDPNRSDLPNYHLTFSFGDQSPMRMIRYKQSINLGRNIAMPLTASAYKQAIESGKGFDMDSTDLRFKDPYKGQIGVLKVKETGRTQEAIDSGFVLDYKGFLNTRELILK